MKVPVENNSLMLRQVFDDDYKEGNPLEFKIETPEMLEQFIVNMYAEYSNKAYLSKSDLIKGMGNKENAAIDETVACVLERIIYASTNHDDAFSFHEEIDNIRIGLIGKLDR